MSLTFTLPVIRLKNTNVRDATIHTRISLKILYHALLVGRAILLVTLMNDPLMPILVLSVILSHLKLLTVSAIRLVPVAFLIEALDRERFITTLKATKFGFHTLSIAKKLRVGAPGFEPEQRS